VPDTPVEPAGGGRYSSDMETRVAILEHIARTTIAALERLERRFDTVDHRFELMERRLDRIETEHHASFRWLLGVMLAGWGSVLGVLGAMFGLMAHGFHWF
jgi:hypothetical protein